MSIPSVLDAAHALAGRGISPGGLAIDATVGNGHDTLFLVKEVGMDGRVLGFDVQVEALTATRERVRSRVSPAADCLRLVHDGHESMGEHLDEADRGRVGAVMFNLGYLPGGDHAVTTEPETTLDALGTAVEVLRPGGIVTIVAYSGHEGGAAETDAVADWITSLPQARFQGLSYRFLNQANDPPRLFAIEKRPASG